MSQYRKFFVAAAGLLVIYLQKHYQIDLFGTEELLADLIMNGGVAALVYLVPNAPAEPAK